MNEMEWRLETPVALFVFNRPGKTKQVLDQIAAVKPSTLLVVADGPRDSHPTDEEKCRRTRTVINNNVDWECEIKRNYSDHNLGLTERFVTGLRWIFESVKEAIILEDDCIPSESFFRFCQEMLDEYRSDERVMEITGTNHLGEWKNDRQDYHFSLYGSIWGWATWRSSWEWYDPEMQLWEEPEIRDRIADVIADEGQFEYVERVYKQTYKGEIDTWDYAWGFARHRNSALSVVPSRNLITNIGFGAEATHTDNEDSELAELPRYELDFPISWNEFLAIDREYDKRFHKIRISNRRFRPELDVLAKFRDIF
jgi:hypothetical protein